MATKVRIGGSNKLGADDMGASGNWRLNRQPRPLTEAELQKLEEYVKDINYSPRYSDDAYEYR